MLGSFPPGAAGLIGAGLLAAAMSSIDSGLNSCTAAITIDFQERFGLRKIPPKMLTLILAVPVIVCAAFLLPELNRNQTLFVLLNKSVNASGTPLLAVMLCALFSKKVHPRAVFYGTAAGIVLTLAITVFVTGIALHYYALFSLLATLGAILLIQFAVRLSGGK